MASQRRRDPAFMGCNVSSELRAQFKEVAVQADRTMAQELRRLIRKRVEAAEHGNTRPPKPDASQNPAEKERESAQA